jgi:hypothetical protein
MHSNFATGSKLYQEFLKLKWIESEKAGKDIGFERALLTWIKKYQSDWKKYRDSIR